MKRFLPASLLGRSLLIIVSPLILLQVVSALIFFETHWDKITQRLARSVAGDIASVITLMQHFPEPADRRWIFDLAAVHMDFNIEFLPSQILPNRRAEPSGLLAETLAEAITSYTGRPVLIDSESLDRDVRIQMQLKDGILNILTPRKRLFSSTTYVFVIWMVGTSLILFAVAMIFMRNQVKPIRRLADAADNFGKGRDVDKFKPEGAKEVRQAAAAFLAMRARILRQIGQRTDMLSGVSHDLRTPLTRMKLQLEMLGKSDDIEALKQDILEMEHMLDGYLAFARGEGGEQSSDCNLRELLEDVMSAARRNGGQIDLHIEGEIQLPLRQNGFRRCVTNLVENALRYASHVSVRAGVRDGAVEIVVDDDGPGIPLEKRAEVFKPFFRIEGSRNPGTGGVGLGLTIARDSVQSHGGDIYLEDSPLGGLRVRIRLPL